VIAPEDGEAPIALKTVIRLSFPSETDSTWTQVKPFPEMVGGFVTPPDWRLVTESKRSLFAEGVTEAVV